MLPPPSSYKTIQYHKSEDHNNSNFLAICTWSNVTVFAPRTAGSSDHLQSTCAVRPLEWSWPCTACWQPQTCHQELSQVQYSTFVMESRYGKLTVHSRSAHGPLAERENILRLYLKVCQQDSTVFVFREGSAEQQQRAVGSQIFKNVANFGYTLDTKISELHIYIYIYIYIWRNQNQI